MWRATSSNRHKNLARMGELTLEVLGQKNKEIPQGEDSKVTCHILNTVSGVFFEGGETSSSRKRYDPRILSVENLLKVKANDPMVIIVKNEDWEIKRVLVNQGSYEDILHLLVFERLCLNPEKHSLEDR